MSSNFRFGTSSGTAPRTAYVISEFNIAVSHSRRSSQAKRTRLSGRHPDGVARGQSRLQGPDRLSGSPLRPFQSVENRSQGTPTTTFKRLLRRRIGSAASICRSYLAGHFGIKTTKQTPFRLLAQRASDFIILHTRYISPHGVAPGRDRWADDVSRLVQRAADVVGPFTPLRCRRESQFFSTRALPCTGSQDTIRISS
jgi:hypothetical protein